MKPTIASDDSDIDLFVVLDSHLDLSHANRRKIIRKTVGTIDVPLDILTCSTEELELALKDEQSFTAQIFKKGRVIYGGFQ